MPKIERIFDDSNAEVNPHLNPFTQLNENQTSAEVVNNKPTPAFKNPSVSLNGASSAALLQSNTSPACFSQAKTPEKLSKPKIDAKPDKEMEASKPLSVQTQAKINQPEITMS